MKVIRGICRVFTWICMILIILMMLLMVADVVARVVFHAGITGATEWAQIMLVCNMTAMGAAILSGRMVKVDMLTSRLKPKAQVIFDIVILLVTLAVVILLCRQQFVYAVKQHVNNVAWTSVKVAQWPFVALFGLSYAVGALTIIATIIRKIVSASKGEYEKEVTLGTMDPVFGKKGAPAKPEDVEKAAEEIPAGDKISVAIREAETIEQKEKEDES